MAEAVFTPTVTYSVGPPNAMYEVFGTLVTTADDYEAGGILLNFLQSAIKASRTPLMVVIQGIAGYIYEYVAGSDASNGLVMIRAQKASASNYDALIEIGDDAAVPAGVVADTINFRATWKGME